MLTPASHVRWAHCDTSAIAVLDLHTGQWRMFEGTAAHLWHALTRHQDTHSLAREIAASLGTESTATHAAVLGYLRQLHAAGLLIDTATAPVIRRRAPWRRKR